MALQEDLLNLLSDPTQDAELKLRIKPLAQPQTAGIPEQPQVDLASETPAGSPAGLAGGAGPTTTATTPTLTGFGMGGSSVLPAAQQLPRKNPTLVTHPLGARTDDIYEAAVAQLGFDTQSRYAQLLQELGFMDDQGNFMPGTLETEAVRQRAELNRQRALALKAVNEAAQRGNTIFSGRRAKNIAQAQEPYDAGIANLATILSRELASRYQGLTDLTRQFELSRNLLLAEAAERIKASLLTNPVGDFGGDGLGEEAAVQPVTEYLDPLRQALTGGAGGRPVQAQ